MLGHYLQLLAEGGQTLDLTIDDCIGELTKKKNKTAREEGKYESNVSSILTQTMEDIMQSTQGKTLTQVNYSLGGRVCKING